MNRINFMAGHSYGTRLHAPQDACWDQLCPLDVKSTDPAQEKLACLKSKLPQVCDCCNKGGMPDCEILIPGQGLMDPCKLLGRGSGGAKDHFCDCVKETCPDCRTRDAFLKNQDQVLKCCQGRCTGGSCDYDCNQIGLNYLTPNSLMGSCLPEKKPPAPPTARSEKGDGFFGQNKTWIFIIAGLVLAVLAVAIIGWYVRKGKRRGRQ